MNVKDKVAIITGGASGIGAAMARRFAAEGAAGVVVADLFGDRAAAVAKELGVNGLGIGCDVSKESDIQALVETAASRFGRVDIYISNAGVLGSWGGIEVANDIWNSQWNVHVMAHVWGARAVLPGMLERGEGYFVVTASAAGLLNLVEAAPYAVTKHAAVGFAELLRIAYGRRGIRVSCLCPQSVRTPMTISAGVDAELSPEQVADTMIATMHEEQFLSLPHPEVLDYFRRKGQDYDRWLAGMQKLQETVNYGKPA